MAAKEKKAKKQQGAGLGKKRLRLSPIAIIDNIVFSKDEMWAYYIVTNSVYDFLSHEAKLSVGNGLVNAFSALMNNREEPLECHMIISSTPVDVDAWEAQIRHTTETWDRSPGFERYIQEQMQFLRNEEYLKKVTYLGVKLGKRGALSLSNSAIDTGVSGVKDRVRTWMDSALKIPGEEISLNEERLARGLEEDLHRDLSVSDLYVSRMTAEEILLTIKRQFYPQMPAPYLDVDHGNRIGPGDMELELSSAIHNKLRHLRFDQMVGHHEVSGYRATMSISRLPKQVAMPYSFPFLYLMTKLGVPFTSFARFTLMPNEKMKKELEKKKKEMADEIQNIAEGGENADTMTGQAAPVAVVDAAEDMQIMNQMLAEGRHPWVVGSYRLVIETRTEDSLKDWCTQIKTHFLNRDILVNWTVGDQMELFLEQMPGDKLREKTHMQTTDLVYLGTSGFSYSSDVGDLISGSDDAERGGK